MKPLPIAICVLIVIGVFLYFFFKPSNDTVATVGTTDDLRDKIALLMKSTKKGSFLVATVQGTNDFIQFSGNASNIQIDFPLVTDRQKGMESVFRSTAIALGLQVVENTGSGGQRFLDINITGSAGEIAATATKLMNKVFGAKENTRIEYELGT